MTARSQMTMRAVIERNGATAVDDYGGPVPPVWGPHRTVACRAWHSREGELDADGRRTLFLDGLVCAVPLSAADVTMRDRVARIEDRRAALLFDGPFAIAAPAVRRSTHIELWLERVQ